MNKSVKTNVAIFLAATMVTGIFAMISPSFIDVEASGDKRDYKHQGSTRQIKRCQCEIHM